ncbi:MAG: cell surface protein, partial [Pirellula sp.]|nr:cell surface protein [Pirellula sp.]
MSKKCSTFAFWAMLCILSASAQEEAAHITGIRLEPTSVSLQSARSYQNILVMADYSDGSTRDVTHSSEITIAPEAIASYDRNIEVVLPQSDGTGQLQARFKEFDVSVPVTVAQSAEQPPIEYRNEVLQVLTKAGCNTGSCHGSASGKDGFRLSLFGYDPEGDWERLTRELNGRRVRKNAPESCLLIQKAIGMVDHTGG